jgi:hypothetical protein
MQARVQQTLTLHSRGYAHLALMPTLARGWSLLCNQDQCDGTSTIARPSLMPASAPQWIARVHALVRSW